MHTRTRLIFCLLAALPGLLPLSSDAQMPMGGKSKAGMDPSLTKLFGKHTAFSTKGDLKMLIPGQKDAMTLPMDMALADGKLRTEVDMQAMGMGMDRVVSIYRPDKKMMFVAIPAFKAYAKVAMTKEEVENAEKTPKVESTPLGKATLDGHPCEKSKEVITGADGQKQEAIVWRATDLKEFPIQIEAKTDEGSFTLRYKKVDFAKPDAKEFEPPAGFKAYDDVQSLMMGVMQQMMQSQGTH